MSGESLRIAIVHASDLGGGAERSVVSLHRGLRAAGHASTLLVGECRTEEPGVEVIPYVRGVPGARRAARSLERRFGWQDIYNPSFRSLRQRLHGNFDVIHFNTLWGSAGYADVAALPALTRGVPGVLTLRDYWMLTGHCAVYFDCMRWKTGCGRCPDLSIQPAIPVDGTRFNWRRKRESVAGANLHVVAISEHLKQQVEASPIFAGKPVSRVYNGIDLDVFQPANAAGREAARKALGITRQDIVVLLAGQTVEGVKQGIASHHAVAALNANRAVPGLKALVIGKSAGVVASQLQIPSIVLPFQSDPNEMARYYQLADVTLVTSEVETFGRIGAESQACGTPVVAFDSGGIPEVVLDGQGGRVVKKKDDVALAGALHELLESLALRSKMGENGVLHVRQNFDQRAIVGEYLDVYRRAMGADTRKQPGEGMPCDTLSAG